MRHKLSNYKIFVIAFLLTQITVTGQQPNSLTVSGRSLPGSFSLFTPGKTASILIDSNDAKVVSLAASAFANDVELISGTRMPISNGGPIGKFNLIAGTVGQSKFIDQLIEKKLIDVKPINNRWECFLITLVKNGDQKSLVIAGSDRRGTAFGIFHLSRLMGVSPFVWWADVVPAKKKQLFVSGSFVSKEPSVQYRGIFINDEDWGLQPWAARNMDTDIKDIGPKTYAKVFELLLRLKANYIWPAMHPCTKAFYYYKENPKVADDYAIVVGGSHCEPMLRNNVFEWAENYEHEYGVKPGEWRYDVNKQQIYKYWDDRIKEAENFESVYTVGMRGVHDGSMPGPKDPDEKLKLLQNVIQDQRSILTTRLHKSPSQVPQIFVPYKEVLSLYRRGLQLEDDVTIIWPDDNHGYIRQLPNASEQKRSGGHGVYYHLSYWGAPHDYLWLSSISPSLIAFEMEKAYRHGAQKLWVFNVGDIKPAELEMQFALDMAWDIKKWNSSNAHKYVRSWASETFGMYEDAIAEIKTLYYQLAASGKPEHLGSVLFTPQQTKERLAAYKLLTAKVDFVKRKIPPSLADAYFELVKYPAFGAALMNEKVLYLRQSQPEKAQRAYDKIQELTKQYNSIIAAGKWNGIMSAKPRDLAIFREPVNADTLRLLKDTLNGKEPFRQLNTDAFISKKETATQNLQVLKGIGASGSGITLAASSAYTVTCQTELPKGNYRIRLKCLPVFALNSDKQLRYSISVNGDTKQVRNVYTEAESTAWKQNVVNGFSFAETTHAISSNGKAAIELTLMDARIVINSIEIFKAD